MASKMTTLLTSSLNKWCQVLVLISSMIMVSSTGWASEAVDESQVRERPHYGVAVMDLIFVRPVTLAATMLGGAVFVLALPITAATGTIGEAGLSLVVDPGAATFFRCLGCTETGWRKLPKKDLGANF